MSLACIIAPVLFLSFLILPPQEALKNEETMSEEWEGVCMKRGLQSQRKWDKGEVWDVCVW